MAAEDCGDQCENTVGMAGFMAGPHPRHEDRTISHHRRLELQNFARKIAADVLEHTKPHERCLLRRMTEQLMPDGDE